MFIVYLPIYLLPTKYLYYTVLTYCYIRENRPHTNTYN